MITDTNRSRRTPSTLLITIAVVLATLSPVVLGEPNSSPTALPGRTFAGSFHDETTTLTLKVDESVPGEAYSGTIVRGETTYPVTADAKNGKLTGTFSDKDGNKFDFTAEVQDGVLKLGTGAVVMTLKKVARNPLENPLPQNPLAVPAPQPAPMPARPTTPPASADGTWLEKLKAAADGGDPAAMNRLGVVYGNGDGVPMDYAKAVECYTLAAKAGSNDAKANLGVMYEEGHGVERDYTHAQELYHEAAQAGSHFAETRLGVMYADAIGVKTDPAEAVKWYRKAADAGYPDGMNYLALCYLNGAGVDADTAQCLAWLEKAAALKLPVALRNLGQIYKFGRGVNKDYAKAMDYFHKAAQLGDAPSIRFIANLYETGLGMKAPDLAQAQAWYQKAAEIGDGESRRWLADTAANGGRPRTVIGKWALDGDLGDDKFTLTLSADGNVTVESANGSSSTGMTYTFSNGAINFPGSSQINKLSIGGTWKLNWTGPDDCSTEDETGKKLTLHRVK